jgi:DNA-binding MarR family transcriptional regulator
VFTLARLARLLERACADPATGQLTLAQYRLLAMIAAGSERASRLADELLLTKPTVSATVETLAERGLLERVADASDRRVVLLQVTDAGRATLADAETAMRVRLDDLLARVDDPGAVTRSLGAVRAALDERRHELHAARVAETSGPSTRDPARVQP